MAISFHKNFTFLDWHLDSKTFELSLSYDLENVGKVTEVLTFPPFEKSVKDKQVIAACDLVHYMCGVSYYKAGLAKNILFKNKQPSDNMLAFIKKTWLHGLAELVYENDLKGFNLKEVSTHNNKEPLRISTPLKPTPLKPPLKALVPLGGGKDSLVTIEELKQLERNIYLFMVGDAQLIKDVAKFIDLPLIQVKRKIDSKLIAYNKQGAFNGHVPITAINSAISILTALLFECDEVVFSNEKSADSENTIDEFGHKVNHQYSKSYEFEKDFSGIIANELKTDIHYYSHQRNCSELKILKKFSNYPHYFPIFSSCNRNFHIDGSHNKQTKWCCNCPKCRFVFLGLSPFIEKETLIAIFSKNMLNDESQQQGFEELLGIKGFKPFECVGEIQESQLAFNLIKGSENWIDDVLVKKFKNLVPTLSNKYMKGIMHG